MDYRLKKQKDFNIAFQKGKRAFSKNISLVYIKAETLKIGITVSKKHGNAVVRNKLKRLIRAVYRNYIKELKNFHIVFIPKINCEMSFETFKKDINYLLKKEMLLNEKNIIVNN